MTRREALEDLARECQAVKHADAAWHELGELLYDLSDPGGPGNSGTVKFWDLYWAIVGASMVGRLETRKSPISNSQSVSGRVPADHGRLV